MGSPQPPDKGFLTMVRQTQSKLELKCLFWMLKLRPIKSYIANKNVEIKMLRGNVN